MSDRIDFRRVADAALASLEALLLEWLPGGRRDGHEYKALNPTRSDGKIGSFSVNLNTGAWGDFATDDKGGDPISLYAYINGVSQLEAAKKLAEQLGVARDRQQQPTKPRADDRRRTEWTPVLPVPATAGDPPKAHLKRGRPEATWEYRDAAGALLGVIYRFRTSDGGKEVLPCVWARNAVTGAEEWHWLAFPTPRPLYGLQALAEHPDRPVLIVEGEKCADAGRAALHDAAGTVPLTCITWPSGSKAVDKADWSPLAGRQVLIWPDCDAQRDKKTLTILPEEQQPGIKAAERIAEVLAELGAKVKIVTIPKPGEKPSGWDIADALAEGWTRDQLLTFLRERQREPATSAKPVSTQREASASEDDADGEPDWKRALIRTDNGVKDAWQNVVYILQKHPEWKDVLGADTFAKSIVVREASPLGHAPGDEWSQDDDVRLGLWLAQIRPRIIVRSMDTLRSGVVAVAKENKFHPVREHLDSLVWDREARVDSWAVKYLGAADTPYHRMVGRIFLINLVRRVYEPGCIMRSVPVLEGAQDKGKSTALRILAAPWFSDTTFDLKHKDVYQQIQGVMLYEISELESFTRSEATLVKAFISSTVDNFRAPYERQNEKHPRQTVFAATTNAVEYLKDWTGNTRFWPLACGLVIDLDGLAAVREQLLAEALHLYRAGERTYPTAEEQQQLFKPEQDRRMMAHPWQDVIADKLEHDPDWKYRPTVSVREAMADLLKIDLARINPQGSESQRVGQILHALGWTKQRASEGSRAWVWKRPPNPADGPAEKSDDEIPF